jgi:hypothetical protein
MRVSDLPSAITRASPARTGENGGSFPGIPGSPTQGHGPLPGGRPPVGARRADRNRHLPSGPVGDPRLVITKRGPRSGPLYLPHQPDLRARRDRLPDAADAAARATHGLDEVSLGELPVGLAALHDLQRLPSIPPIPTGRFRSDSEQEIPIRKIAIRGCPHPLGADMLRCVQRIPPRAVARGRAPERVGGPRPGDAPHKGRGGGECGRTRRHRGPPRRPPRSGRNAEGPQPGAQEGT